MSTTLLWPVPIHVPVLSNREVHVYRTQLNQPETIAQSLTQTLSPEEKERAQRFHSEWDRRQFVVGRGWLRFILAHHVGVRPEVIEFCYRARGKPELATVEGRPAVQFNMSHSNGIALLAVTLGRRLGVDLEQIRPVPELECLVNQFFSPGEQAEFGCLPVSRKLESFFWGWTRKEAYLKATEEGLWTSLDQFEVPLAPESPPRLIRVSDRPGDVARWCFRDLAPAPGYVGCLAAEGCGWQLKCFTIEPTDLGLKQ